MAYPFIILCGVYFSGIIGRVKSITAGRQGPGLFQPMKDVIRLLKKDAVFSNTTSWVFQVGPTIYLASVLMAAFFVPFGAYSGALSFTGDVIFFAYALALGKFFLILNALDTGSAFEGMGANREAIYSMLVEPTFFILMGTFALITGKTSFHEILNVDYFASPSTLFLAVLAAYILIMLGMVENSRLPVDDPKTHLELTMVHEVMVLDNSGPDLGFIQIASHLKYAIFGGLAANFFMPPAWPIWAHILIFVGFQALYAIIIGLFESFRARLRMKHNPQFLLALTSLAIVVFFSALILTNKFGI